MTAPEHFGTEADGSPSSETIKRKGKALEIGSGHNSMSRTKIIADKSAFTPDDTHRCGEILTCPHQQLSGPENLSSEVQIHNRQRCNDRHGGILAL